MNKEFDSPSAKSERSGLCRLWRGQGVWIVRFVFLFPGLLYFGLFHFYPVANSFYLSFFQWSILTTRKGKPFVGFSNYLDILKDPVFREVTWNTLYFSFWAVAGTVVLGLVLASLFFYVCPWMRKVGRGVMFVPVVTLMVAAALLWKWLFESLGLINYLLSFFGLGPYYWLVSFKLAMPAVIIMTIWKQVGFTMVIFLTALLQVPAQYLESADIEGAGEFRKWWYISLPLIKPITMLVVIIQMIVSFQVFIQVFIMTGGGPGNTTRTLVQYIYEKGFVYWAMGHAAAMSVLLFIAILFMTLIQFRYFGGSYKG